MLLIVKKSKPKRATRNSRQRAPLLAEDLMVHPVESVNWTDKMHDVACIFMRMRIGAVAVIGSHGRHIGVVTKTDLVRYSKDKEERSAQTNGVNGVQILSGADTVAQWMTPIIFSVKPETPIKEIARRMVRYNIHHVFVRGKSVGTMSGIVSSMDILRWVSSL